MPKKIWLRRPESILIECTAPSDMGQISEQIKLKSLVAHGDVWDAAVVCRQPGDRREVTVVSAGREFDRRAVAQSRRH
jgi:hypothetical protein